MRAVGNDKTLRGVVVGCGFYAPMHLRAWQELDGVEIIGVCDLVEDRRRLVAEKFAIPRTYADLEQMLKSEHPDFVDIITTMGHHRPMVEMAASFGTPVICQKPIAPTLSDAQAMVDTCRKAGIPMMIHENFRWRTPMLAVRHVLDQSRIGSPFFARLSYRGCVADYVNQPYLVHDPRLILMDIGVHLADLCRFFMGEAASVACHTSRINSKVAGEDVATALIRHRNGAVSILDMSFATKAKPDLFSQVLVRVEGDDGTIDVGPDFNLAVTSGDELETCRVPPKATEGIAFPGCLTYESVVRTQQHWIECLRSGRQPETSGADNLKTFCIVEAAYQSAAWGKVIEV
jgi:D-apiose dehydrogenase